MSELADFLEAALYTGIGFAKRKENKKKASEAMKAQEDIIRSEQVRKAAELQAKLQNQKDIARIKSSAAANTAKSKIPTQDYFGNTAKYEVEAQERLKKLDPMSLTNPNYKLIISLEAIRSNPDITTETKDKATAAINKLKKNEDAAEDINFIKTKYKQLPEITKIQASTGNKKKKFGLIDKIKSYIPGK